MKYHFITLDLVAILKAITIENCQFDLKEWSSEDIDCLEKIVKFLKREKEGRVNHE